MNRIARIASAVALALAITTGAANAHFPRGTVSLDLRDTDVRDVLLLFANQYKLNVIVGQDVTGKVTLTLHEVPIQTAFTSILDNAGLGYQQQGAILRVNTLKTIKANRADEPLVTRVVTLNYFTTRFGARSASRVSSGTQGGSDDRDDDLDQLQKSLEKHLSGTAGSSVTIVPRTNSVIVTDVASNVDRLVQLATRLDVETPQVLIEAQIFEVDANYSRALGVTTSFNAARTVNTQVGGGGAGNFPGVSGRSPIEVAPGPFGSLGVTSGASAFDFFLRNLGGSDLANVQVVLQAAEANGLARMLAAPRVTTLNNKEAVVSSGQRIPFTTIGSIAQQGGTNLVATVEFIDAALELAVTPHVTGDGKIMMRVRATRNSADFSNTVFQNPTINTREALNEVLVPNGETVVIGGIYTDDSFKTRGGTPFLKDVPVLGHFFKNDNKDDAQMELVFLITPRVVSDPSVIRATAEQTNGISPQMAPATASR
jgi:type IV pilus assembly protein PilQ